MWKKSGLTAAAIDKKWKHTSPDYLWLHITFGYFLIARSLVGSGGDADAIRFDVVIRKRLLYGKVCGAPRNTPCATSGGERVFAGLLPDRLWMLLCMYVGVAIYKGGGIGPEPAFMGFEPLPRRVLKGGDVGPRRFLC